MIVEKIMMIRSKNINDSTSNNNNNDNDGETCIDSDNNQGNSVNDTSLFSICESIVHGSVGWE